MATAPHISTMTGSADALNDKSPGIMVFRAMFVVNQTCSGRPGRLFSPGGPGPLIAYVRRDILGRR